MKILVVTDKFFPHAGGTAVCWTEWSTRWTNLKPRIITRGFPGNSSGRNFKFPIVRVPFVDIPKLRMVLLWLSLWLTTLIFLIIDRPKVLYCAQVLETGWIGLFFRFFTGTPYVIVLYGEEVLTYSKRPLTRRLLNLILNHAQAVAAITQYTARITRRHTTYSGTISVVYPGVDLNRFRTSQRPRQEFTLLTVARLMKRKGHDFILRVLPDLLLKFPQLKYRIVGVGPDEQRLRRIAQEYQLGDSVEFLGKASEEELVHEFQSATLFVHPNRELAEGDVEGFGIVFLEASACGLPVIGGRSGGATEAIADGVTGYLVDPESSSDIKNRIEELLADRELRLKMGADGPAWARRFNWETSALRLQDLAQG